MIRLIIFDFDGTLGDTRATIIATMQDTLREKGLPEPSEQEIGATIGVPLEEGFRILCPEFGKEMIDGLAQTYRVIFERNRKKYVPALFPKVRETLAALKEQGFTLTVASSRLSVSLLVFLREMGIRPYISYVLGADNVDKAKPDPEPVLKTMRELGFTPAETLVVGDMPVDVLMGSRAGARTVAVTYGNATLQELEKAAPDFITDDFSQLEAIVRQLG